MKLKFPSFLSKHIQQSNRSANMNWWKRREWMSQGEEWRKKWFQSLLSLVAIIVVIVYQRNTMFFVWTERSETRRLGVRSSKIHSRSDFQCLNWIYIFAAWLSCRTTDTRTTQWREWRHNCWYHRANSPSTIHHHSTTETINTESFML